MKITVLLSSILLLSITGVTTSTKMMDDLASAAKTRWCIGHPTLDQTCVNAIIEGYLSLYDVCAERQLSKCDLCIDRAKYIKTKIPLTKTQYNSSEFSAIALSMAVSVIDPKLSCSSANNGSIDHYLNAAVTSKSMKRDSEDWITSIYKSSVDRLDTSSFTKCASFKSLISKINPLALSSDKSMVQSILTEMVLHQISGSLLSQDCELLPPPQLVLNDLYRFMGLQSTKDLVMESNLNIIIESLNLDKESLSEAPEEHHHHHDVVKRSVLVKDSLSSISRPRRSSSPSTNCLSLDNIYGIYNYNKTTGLNLKQFRNIVPILLQQSTSCKKEVTTAYRMTSLAERYGWGTLSVSIICLCSIFGLVLVPLGNKEYFQLFIVFFVALGVGTLVGDAVLHLIPECMGLHVDDPKVIWKLIGSLMSLLAMFILENMLSLCKKKKPANDKDEHKGHSHMPNFDDLQKSTIMTEENNGNDVQIEAVKVPLSAAIMVIMGDAIHNFADGLALGAAFTSSVQKGISTSIAIFCHELPHEFGDFAILLASGFKWKWALLANLLSSLTAFAGLYIGIAISSESPLTQQIIFAITSGMFLYVALTDMLPSLIELSKQSRAKMFVLEVIGIALGMTTMALLSFFEESIQI